VVELDVGPTSDPEVAPLPEEAALWPVPELPPPVAEKPADEPHPDGAATAHAANRKSTVDDVTKVFMRRLSHEHGASVV
jgi:hypothetical protein